MATVYLIIIIIIIIVVVVVVVVDWNNYDGEIVLVDERKGGENHL